MSIFEKKEKNLNELINKLDVLIHPQALVHSIFEFQNYVTNIIYFHHDMNIPLFNFFNQKNYSIPKKNINYN